MAKYWIYSRNILYLCIYVYLFYNLGVVSSFLGDPKISCEASLKTTSSLSSKFSYFLVRHTCSSMVCISCTWFYLLKQLFWFPVCIHRIVDQLVGGSCRWGPSSRPTAASCHPRRRSCPPLGWHAWLLLLSAWIKVFESNFWSNFILNFLCIPNISDSHACWFSLVCLVTAVFVLLAAVKACTSLPAKKKRRNDNWYPSLSYF